MNVLLPTDNFITVMRGLMGNELPSVRRKAMELLNNKLQHRTQWDEEHVTMTTLYLVNITTGAAILVRPPPVHHRCLNCWT